MDTPLTAEKSPDTSITSDFRRSIPSRLTQTYCLNTTVPINIVGSDIGGRHTPTKQALRHSRMIAMSQAGKKGAGNLSVIIKNPGLAKYFICLQNNVAVVIVVIAAWMINTIPSMRHWYIPYWSGGLLLLSGLLNAIFICCCKRKFSNDPSWWYPFYPKIITLSVTILAALSCLCALVFASIHIYVIEIAVCELEESSGTSCVCRVADNSMDLIDVGVQPYHYESLNCTSVTGILVIALIGSAVANAFGVVISLYYVFLHKTGTFSHKYSQVPASDYSPTYL